MQSHHYGAIHPRRSGQYSILRTCCIKRNTVPHNRQLAFTNGVVKCCHHVTENRQVNRQHTVATIGIDSGKRLCKDTVCQIREPMQ